VRSEVGKALRGDTQRIADGEADAPLAEIERQNAGMRFGQFHYIIDACACHTRARVHIRDKRSGSHVALITQSGTAASAAKAAHDARQLAMPWWRSA